MNNPEARARRDAASYERVKRRRLDPEYRERERRVNLARYYARKAEKLAAQQAFQKTLETSSLVVGVK